MAGATKREGGWGCEFLPLELEVLAKTFPTLKRGEGGLEKF